MNSRRWHRPQGGVIRPLLVPARGSRLRRGKSLTPPFSALIDFAPYWFYHFAARMNCRPFQFKRFRHCFAFAGLTVVYQFYHFIALCGFAVLPSVPISGFSGLSVFTFFACALPVLPFYLPYHFYLFCHFRRTCRLLLLLPFVSISGPVGFNVFAISPAPTGFTILPSLPF